MMVIYLLTTRECNLTVHEMKANKKKNNNKLIVASFAQIYFDHPYRTWPLILPESTPETASVSNYFLKFNILNYWLF